MATKVQTIDLFTVMCECRHQVPHPLGSHGCTETVTPGTYGSWKPPYTGKPAPAYPVAAIYAELARLASDKATRDRYRQQAAITRYAAKY